MSVFNIYFSPTGGTKRVSDIISSALSENYEPVDLIKKDGFAHQFGKDDICVISVPAFGGRVPENAVQKLKSMSSDKAKAIIVAVFGNRAIDDTLVELNDLAESAGFDVVAGIEAVAEHSLARMYGKNRPDEADKTQLETFAQKIADKLAGEIFLPPEIPGNRPYKEFRAMAMSPSVDDSCVNCKKCVRECPVGAIPEDDVKSVDAQKCFSCMHCVAVCPMKARHNAPEVSKGFEERLRERCAGVKPNKLYL